MTPARSRRAVLALGAAAATLPLAPGNLRAGEAGFRRIRKGVWVWRTEAALGALHAFAARWDIGRIMLSFRAPAREALLRGDSEMLGGIARLRAGGSAVFALTGDPAWPRAPGRVPASLADLARIQEKHGIFDGLHLDVEPHVLPEWRNDAVARGALMAGLVAFLQTARALVPGWPIEAALHPQYSRLALPSGESLMAALMAQIEAVSLMAYRDDAARLIALAAPSIEVFERAAKPWRLGVLVHADKEKGVSYWGADRARLLEEMKRLDEIARKSAAGSRHYRGLMFEDFDGLRSMLAA